MHTLRKCILIIVFGVIVGCRSAPQPPVNTPPAVTVPVSPSAVTRASATLTQPTTKTVDTIEATADYGATQLSIEPPTPTPRKPNALQDLPTSYNLPAWLLDPQAVIVLTLTHDLFGDEDHFTFIDLPHQRRFDLLAPHSYHAAWGQNEGGLYFAYDRTVPLGNENWEYYDERAYVGSGRIERRRVDQDDSGPIRTAAIERFVAYASKTDAGIVVRLTDNHMGQTVILDDVFAGRYADTVELSWSFSQELLTVVRYRWADQPYRPHATGVAIYTVDGRVYRRYEGLGSVAWSPDNTRRLLYAVGNDYGSRTPCIMDVVASTSQCLEAVTTWRAEHNVQTEDYQWHPNENAVSFVYWNDNDTGGPSGLCWVQLATGEFSCPLTERALGPNAFVIAYAWSPAGDYLALTINNAGPLSDDVYLAQVATAASDGSGYTVWGPGAHPFSWRPALPP
jgi:hypothetical protein